MSKWYSGIYSPLIIESNLNSKFSNIQLNTSVCNHCCVLSRRLCYHDRKCLPNAQHITGTILNLTYYMVHIIWTKSYGPYHMDHVIWTKSYGPYHMDHIIWRSLFKAMTCVSLSICNRPEPSKSSKQNSKMDKRVVEFPNPNIVWVSLSYGSIWYRLYHMAPFNMVHIIWNSYLELARIIF